MSTIDDKLNEVLNITTEVMPIEVVEEKKEIVIPKDKDPDTDFEVGRENLYKLLDKGNEAIRRATLTNDEYQAIYCAMRTYTANHNKLDDTELKVRKIV